MISVLDLLTLLGIFYIVDLTHKHKSEAKRVVERQRYSILLFICEFYEFSSFLFAVETDWVSSM